MSTSRTAASVTGSPFPAHWSRTTATVVRPQAQKERRPGIPSGDALPDDPVAEVAEPLRQHFGVDRAVLDQRGGPRPRIGLPDLKVEMPQLSGQGSNRIFTGRIIENSIRRNRDRWLRGRNQETC